MELGCFLAGLMFSMADSRKSSVKAPLAKSGMLSAPVLQTRSAAHGLSAARHGDVRVVWDNAVL
jgi:hypothetical protein